MNTKQTEDRLTVLFYISGHGFGHSTRVIEVARHLPQEVRIIFKTTAPQWLYECYCDRPMEFAPLQMDVGVIQNDSLSLNAEKTLSAYEEIFHRAPGLIEQECDYVRREGVNLVAADIPPLAFDIAARAGVPSVGMTNFSWDWIYSPYVKRQPEYTWLMDEIRKSYGKCSLLLRLPFYGDLSAFPHIQDTPLVVRQPQGDREELRKRLGLDLSRKIVLLSFGGFDLERIPWERIGQMKEYQFIYFRSAVPAENVLHVPNGVLPHVDIVQLADLVLSKPGYGICAECIETQTPILYTDRGEFLEYDYLVEGLKRYARSLYIPQDELLAGNWSPWLEQAICLPPAREQLATDGAAIAARRMVELARCGLD